MKLGLSAIFSVLALGMVACDVTLAPTNNEMVSTISSAVDRNVTSPMGYHISGWNQKDSTAQVGWFVMGMSSGNSYFGSNYTYVAINTAEWSQQAKNRSISVDAFADQYFRGQIYLSQYDQDRLFRSVSYSGSGYYVDSHGNYYDAAGAVQKDLEVLASITDQATIQETGRKLSAQFSLSDEQGLRVARLATEWQTLSKSRQMTAKDLDAFTSDLVGVNMAEVRDAAKRAADGDRSSIDSLLNRAAQGLDTTPENVKNILETFSGN